MRQKTVGTPTNPGAAHGAALLINAAFTPTAASGEERIGNDVP